MNRNTYAGIPANERVNVRQWQGIYLAQGRKMTPQQAYADMLLHREEQAKQDAQEGARKEKERRRYARESAKRDAVKALRTLLGAWQMAQGIEEGQSLEPAMNEQDMGAYIRMAIKEAGTQLEEALVAFEVLTPEQADAFRE